MTEPVRTVKLGDHRIPVVGQRHARIEHGVRRLGFEDRESYYLAIASPLGDLGKERYKQLSLAIPKIEENIPLHEWCGYASAEAMKKRKYDPEKDRSPTDDEIVAAGHEVVKVAGLERLGKLVGIAEMIGSLTKQASQANENSTQLAPTSAGATGE